MYCNHCGTAVQKGATRCGCCGAAFLPVSTPLPEISDVNYDFEEPDSGPGLWGIYYIGYWICFVLVFLGTWGYCISEYGFLLGVGLGWLPGLITAGIVSLLWPLVLVACVAFAWTLFHS